MPENKENKGSNPRSRSRRGSAQRRSKGDDGKSRRGKESSSKTKPTSDKSPTRGDKSFRPSSPKIRKGSTKLSADGRKPTVTYIRELKGKRPIVALTAYDAPMARLVSDAGVDFLLVGDSVGTTQLGFQTTVPVTLDAMVHHTAAVRRGNPECLLVADLPFGEASLSLDRLLESCRRLMQEGGADAVKLEGGRDIADDIERLVATGIPVLGHVGLLPQTVKAIGGYRKFANDREEAEEIFTDAIALEEAGCFAIVAEMVQDKVAAELAKHLGPPLIGIGSGAGCDGQILVTPDLLNLTPGPPPSFVKPYADLTREASKALGRFVEDVRSGHYPAK